MEDNKRALPITYEIFFGMSSYYVCCYWGKVLDELIGIYAMACTVLLLLLTGLLVFIVALLMIGLIVGLTVLLLLSR